MEASPKIQEKSIFEKQALALYTEIIRSCESNSLLIAMLLSDGVAGFKSTNVDNLRAGFFGRQFSLGPKFPDRISHYVPMLPGLVGDFSQETLNAIHAPINLEYPDLFVEGFSANRRIHHNLLAGCAGVEDKITETIRDRAMRSSIYYGATRSLTGISSPRSMERRSELLKIAQSMGGPIGEEIDYGFMEEDRERMHIEMALLESLAGVEIPEADYMRVYALSQIERLKEDKNSKVMRYVDGIEDALFKGCIGVDTPFVRKIRQVYLAQEDPIKTNEVLRSYALIDTPASYQIREQYREGTGGLDLNLVTSRYAALLESVSGIEHPLASNVRSSAYRALSDFNANATSIASLYMRSFSTWNVGAVKVARSQRENINAGSAESRPVKTFDELMSGAQDYFASRGAGCRMSIESAKNYI